MLGEGVWYGVNLQVGIGWEVEGREGNIPENTGGKSCSQAPRAQLENVLFSH